MKPVLAAVVLYKMRSEESPSCRMMRAALRERGELAATFELVLFDNSPQARPPVGHDGLVHYVHDGSNEGLARRYNQALAMAVASGSQWLLLLDQDTEVTLEYLEEVKQLAGDLSMEQNAVAAVPKLTMRGQVLSPHLKQYVPSPFEVDAATHGFLPGPVRVFNSGAMVRVSALQQIGGFPETYWLDYLDHATFQKLQAAGGRVWVMDAQLPHALSEWEEGAEEGPVRAARHADQLRAAGTFYDEFGSVRERVAFRRHMMREALGAARRGQGGRAIRFMRTALRFPRTTARSQ